MHTALAGPEPALVVLVAVLVELVHMVVEQVPGAAEAWVQPVVDIQDSSREVVQLVVLPVGPAEQAELVLGQPMSRRASRGSSGPLVAGEEVTGRWRMLVAALGAAALLP